MKLYSKTVSAGCFIGLMTCALISAGTGGEPQKSNPTAGKSYQIRNKQYGELLRPEEANSADGTPIVLYPAQAWKCMTWKLQPAGDSQFSLQNHFTSKTFKAKAGGDVPDSTVIQVPFGKKPEERPAWQFSRLKDGTYKIADATTGKVLSAQKSPSGSGANICLQSWADKDYQKWELQEIDPAKLTM